MRSLRTTGQPSISSYPKPHKEDSLTDWTTHLRCQFSHNATVQLLVRTKIRRARRHAYRWQNKCPHVVTTGSAHGSVKHDRQWYEGFPDFASVTSSLKNNGPGLGLVLDAALTASLTMGVSFGRKAPDLSPVGGPELGGGVGRGLAARSDTLRSHP